MKKVKLKPKWEDISNIAFTIAIAILLPIGVYKFVFDTSNEMIPMEEISHCNVVYSEDGSSWSSVCTAKENPQANVDNQN